MGKRRCGNKNSKRHHRKSKAESTNPTRLDLCDANDDDIQEDKNGVLEYQEDRSLIIRAASLTPVSSPLSICLPNIVLQNPIDRSISKVSYSKNTSSRKKIVRRLTFYAAIAALLLLLFGSVTKIQGVRRTWKFWKLVFPVVLDYKLELWHLHFWKGIRDDDALSKALMPFHERNAPRVYRIVIEMGGMFIKVGQIIGTVGIGIVPDPYVMALRHLQNGVEPRTYEEIAAIIEHSTGQKMEDLFEVFHPQPLGAASIAQAHKAVIKQNNETVVIKVQYPDVAESFYVDFTNVELFTLIVNPEDMEFIQSVRRNHERELDFTVEAQNLREVQLNLQRHGVEPSLVRIPNVRNETGICSPTILALEFLPGISLKSAIDDEQHRMALGLGMQNVQDLRQSIAMRMREQHYHADRTPEQQAAFSVRQAKMLQQFGPALAGILRVVGAIKEWWGERVMGNDHMAVTSSLMKQQQQQHVNLGRALKTMVHVHGLQLLKDGVMNMDPHPGNILIMPDGRLGLLDYGMVGRISVHDRRRIAAIVVALAKNDKKEVVRLYQDGGYSASWKEGKITDVNILHRFASFHLDKLDLSPVVTEDHRTIDILHILHSTVEHNVPHWKEACGRMGTLMLGAAAQAARPMSLSHEWVRIAKQTIKELDNGLNKV